MHVAGREGGEESRQGVGSVNGRGGKIRVSFACCRGGWGWTGEWEGKMGGVE